MKPFSLNPIQRLDLYRHIENILQESLNAKQKLYSGGLCLLIEETLYRKDSPLHNPNYEQHYVYHGMHFLPELLAQKPHDKPHDAYTYWFKRFGENGEDVGTLPRLQAIQEAIKLVPVI